MCIRVQYFAFLLTLLCVEHRKSFDKGTVHVHLVFMKEKLTQRLVYLGRMYFNQLLGKGTFRVVPEKGTFWSKC